MDAKQTYTPDEIVSCPKCGQRNRIGAYARRAAAGAYGSKVVQCGRCHASLTRPVVAPTTTYEHIGRVDGGSFDEFFRRMFGL